MDVRKPRPDSRIAGWRGPSFALTSPAINWYCLRRGNQGGVVCPGFVRTGIFEAATVLKARREDAVAKAEPLSMNVNQAARKILRGVERNKQIINFPFSARLIWWLHRLHPSIPALLMRKGIKDFRAIRIED